MTSREQSEIWKERWNEFFEMHRCLFCENIFQRSSQGQLISFHKNAAHTRRRDIFLNTGSNRTFCENKRVTLPAAYRAPL